MYFYIILAILLFINMMMLIVIILIGGSIMDAIRQAITNLEAAVTELQNRVGAGVFVNPADLAAIVTSINQVATTVGTIAQ